MCCLSDDPFALQEILINAIVCPNEWNNLKFSQLFNRLNSTIMAEVVGPLLIKGSIGGISVYWNSRLKKWIARQKGGANKNLIDNSPVFVRTRENNVEFTACNKWCGKFRLALLNLDHLNCGYYMGGVVQIVKNIQLMDQDSLKGHRNIEPSKYKSFLTEIVFNEEHPFKQVLLRRPEVTTDDDRQSVTMNLPQFYPKGELIWRKPYSLYRLTLTVAQISDYVWVDLQRGYEMTYPDIESKSVTVYSDWMLPSVETIDLSLTASFDDQAIPPAGSTVMVAAGIEFATRLSNNTVSWTKGDGTMALIECL
jgi:hypothetical protein